MTAKRVLAACLVTIGLGGPALAQTAPACSGEVHDDFDFWVGTWNVYAPDGGAYQGVNIIRKGQGDCLIHENWNGAGGSTGESINFYDPFEESWRQVWVSAGAIIDYTGGLNAAGEMVLEGEIYYPSNGNRAPFRGIWTPLDDGTVRQHFDQQNSDGEWSAWFTGIYVRQEDDPRAAEAEAARGG